MTGQNSPFASDWRTLFQIGTMSGLSDDQLIERFTDSPQGAGELAFSILVERHGAMVLGVCRRLLGDVHDAEDAFQATFMILARKAKTLRRPELVGSWLHGVARKAALKAKTKRDKLRRSEGSIPIDLNLVEEVDSVRRDDDLRDQFEILHREIASLPERYRIPIVLCDLEGLKHEEAARRIGCAVGTLSSRLSRGRTILKDRLIRKGVAHRSEAIAQATAPSIVKAHVSTLLMTNTVRAASALAATRSSSSVVLKASAAALTQEMFKAMLISKITIASVVLTSTLGIVGGVGAFAAHRRAKQEPEKPSAVQSGEVKVEKQAQKAPIPIRSNKAEIKEMEARKRDDAKAAAEQDDRIIDMMAASADSAVERSFATGSSAAFAQSAAPRARSWEIERKFLEHIKFFRTAARQRDRLPNILEARDDYDKASTEVEKDRAEIMDTIDSLKSQLTDIDFCIQNTKMLMQTQSLRLEHADADLAIAKNRMSNYAGGRPLENTLKLQKIEKAREMIRSDLDRLRMELSMYMEKMKSTSDSLRRLQGLLDRYGKLGDPIPIEKAEPKSGKSKPDEPERVKQEKKY